MMRGHLTPADYTRMPWANGRGTTTELIRVARPDGGVLWRLSMASVVEDGPFSLFAGIERNLTVISGPGFDLTGPGRLRADPLVPVAFPGDVAISAERVRAPSEDFNVMTDRTLPLPKVRVQGQGSLIDWAAQLCILALAPTRIEADGTITTLARHDLHLGQGPVRILGPGQVISVALSL